MTNLILCLRVLVRIPAAVLTVLNTIVYIGSVIAMLKAWIGCFAYLAWVVVAPLCVPAIIILPWFDAWTADGHVSERVFWAWVLWLAVMAVGIPLEWIADHLGLDSRCSRS